KDDRLENRTALARHVVHRHPPRIDSEDRHRFSISAICHVLLHPIALVRDSVSALGSWWYLYRAT
ncbi:MAG TPA: hypothetical protein VKM54_07720, partial [Myxococcota bacterium]|nr:hypothetical protein [Myxococcota bacterium]